jgi:hypothetical protein
LPGGFEDSRDLTDKLASFVAGRLPEINAARIYLVAMTTVGVCVAAIYILSTPFPVTPTASAGNDGFVVPAHRHGRTGAAALTMITGLPGKSSLRRVIEAWFSDPRARPLALPAVRRHRFTCGPDPKDRVRERGKTAAGRWFLRALLLSPRTVLSKRNSDRVGHSRNIRSAGIEDQVVELLGGNLTLSPSI